MKQNIDVPVKSYGVTQQDKSDSDFEEISEQIKRLGFGVLDSGFTKEDLYKISDEFNRIHINYVNTWGKERLLKVGEENTIRLPLSQHGQEWFIRLALNARLLKIVQMLISGKFILNQQNGLINPPGEPYSQSAWHRDLPYQHYVSSVPLAITALFCIDDFTIDNGATFMLPSSHKFETFPSQEYVRRNALQVEAKAGQYIILDSMLFHSGGHNRTNRPRRAVNHIFNIPFFKQQIRIPGLVTDQNLTPVEREIFGFNYSEIVSISEYLKSRENKNH